MNLLILSIGSNPMPNFIVANYLLNRDRNDQDEIPVPGMILFVYSSATEKFKDKIIELLQSKVPAFEKIYVDIGTEERNFDRIRKAVVAELEKHKGLLSIHLNYTGGTKPMAVAVFAAVTEYSFQKNQPMVSDLSPRDFRLTLRDNRRYPSTGSGRNITDYVKISVEELYELHNLDLPKKKRSSSQFYTEKIAKFLVDKVADYKSGDEDFLRTWDGVKNRRNKIEFTEQEKLLQRLPEDYLKCRDIRAEEELSPVKRAKKMKPLIAFVRGNWLEEYIFNTLQGLEKECGLTDIAFNVETEVNRRSFEIDVIAIKGCQAFIFTCTTDYKMKMCKGKAFEGIYRAEQLGGAQAKTVLVCMADDNAENEGNRVISNIRKDMSQFDTAINFSILGIDDVKNSEELKLKLKNIINGV